MHRKPLHDRQRELRALQMRDAITMGEVFTIDAAVEVPTRPGVPEESKAVLALQDWYAKDRSKRKMFPVSNHLDHCRF